jgi:hypothetical protein
MTGARSQRQFIKPLALGSLREGQCPDLIDPSPCGAIDSDKATYHAEKQTDPAHHRLDDSLVLHSDIKDGMMTRELFRWKEGFRRQETDYGT